MTLTRLTGLRDSKMSVVNSSKLFKIGPSLYILSIGKYSKLNLCCSQHTSKCLDHDIASQRRTFFAWSGNKTKEYSGRKLVGYTMDQMFAVVADVESYYTFVPWCKKSKVLSKKSNSINAELVVGFPPISERYISKVTLAAPHLVKAECTDGMLFNHLLTLWRFSSGQRENPKSCVVDFQVSFEFKLAFHSQLTNLFFDQVVLRMEGAFVKEATRRYGMPSINTQVISTGNVLKA